MDYATQLGILTVCTCGIFVSIVQLYRIYRGDR